MVDDTFMPNKNSLQAVKRALPSKLGSIEQA